MKSIELFRKAGYEKMFDDRSIVMYNLKEKSEYSRLPDIITINKANKEVSFDKEFTDKVVNRWGKVCIEVNKELLQAIIKKIEELGR